MHWMPEMLNLPEKQQQSPRWQRQIQFFKDRVIAKNKTSPDVIAVEFSFDDNGFDILSWTINMAARPGDHIVALRFRTLDTMHLRKGGQNNKQEAIDAHLKPLRDLCDVKQVQLELRLAVNETVEKLLVAEASALRANILVVSASGHSSLRRAQKRGSFLAKNVPAECSVVVVKNYKVLYYKADSSIDSAERNFTVVNDVNLTSSRQSNQDLENKSGYLQDRLPVITVRETESHCALDTTIISCKKIWPETTWTGSPTRIFEGPGHSSESDESPTSGLFSRLPLSSSRKALAHRSYSHGDGDIFSKRQNHSWLGYHRSCSMPRLQIFPSRHIFRKICSSFPYRTLGNSLKSYINGVWGMMVLKKSASSEPSMLSERSKSTNGWKHFTYEEISKATKFFSPENIVGRGGHAEVYKGTLPCGQLVAVKRLIRGDTEEQRVRDFLTELGIVCHISHPNATPLVGFCIEKGLHLIFQFSPQGSLASWLHGPTLPPLRWQERYKVAVGTASGLNYLHTGCQRRIIHRDIKASNILLGPNFEPQISDFGLAKWLPDQCSHHVLTPIEGTFGYLAPEYFMHGIVDEKTDVFAFGVLLLELITGRKPIESSQPSLVIWARSFLENMKFEELADARLNGAYDPQEMQCMMMAAGLCVQQSPICRPRMNQVLQLLTDELNSDIAFTWSTVSSQSFFEDSLFDGDYSCINYRNDLRRHREVALQF